jgi:molybdopterin-guanine dinucleotide biosynthesis protein A
MTLTAVLFAGGQSRRMGADKATLVFAGGPLWARQLGALRDLKPDTLWVSARERPAWCPAEIEAVLDAPPARGPLSGLAAVLGRVRTTHMLALAVDLPLMTKEHLQKLWAQAQPGCGVMPLTGDDFEPLCAIYPVEAGAAAADALAGGRLVLQSFAKFLVEQKRARIYLLAESERAFYRNVNTRADLT